MDSVNIVNIDLVGKNINDNPEIVDQCQEIINENLVINGGTLKQADILKGNYSWTNLFIAVENSAVVGFLLMRASRGNEHNIECSDFHYYISDIVVKKSHQNRKIGRRLMDKAFECRTDFPIVASALTSNEFSIKLLSNYMTVYGTSPSGKYLRFLDNKTYENYYSDTIENESGMRM